MKQFRQGDVPGIALNDDVWDNLKGEDIKFSGDALTLIEGEATGHHHQVYPANNLLAAVKYGEKDGLNVFLIKLSAPTELRHFNVLTQKPTKEHNSITLPAGSWVVTNQRQGTKRSILPVAD